MAILVNNPPSNNGYVPSQPSSDILQTTGSNEGGFLGDFSLNSILGLDKANSFYTEFYRNLLTTGNCPPINALWLVFINDIPASATIQNIYKERDNATAFTGQSLQKASQEGRRQRGILLAQGVKHTGDGVEFSRDGYKNTGLWKGVLSNGRSEINTLDISFLESNVSFVDYSLRPWSIAVAHSGLTNQALYANNITVWHLSKMGARTNFAKRKVFKYHNCFPISIDQQEYNYSGDDVNVKRVVSFGYHYYTMEEADANVLDLLTYSTDEETGITKAIQGFLSSQVEGAIGQLQTQFGANSLSQYLNNIVERGKSFASSVISNTVQGAVTNVAGAVQGAVDGAIRDVTSAGFALGNEAVSTIAGATNDAINSIVGSNPNSDTTNGVNINLGGEATRGAVQAVSENASVERLGQYGYVEKSFNTDDTPKFEVPLVDREQEEVADGTKVDVNVTVNENDTPNNLTNDVTENADGGITIERNFDTGNPNDDTPNFLGSPTLNLLYYTEKSINEDDTPTFATGEQDSKPVNAFTKGTDKATQANIDAVENAFAVTVDINANDSDIGDEIPFYEEKEVASSSLDTSSGVRFNEIQVPNNDSNPSDSVSFNQVNVPENDSNPSDSVSFNQVNVSENDSNPSDNVSFNQVNVSENDSNPSDSISYNEISINENDSNPSDNATFNQVNISENDSNPSDSVSFKELSVREDDVISNENIKYKKVETKTNTPNPSEGVKYKDIKLNQNDSTISNNIKYKEKKVSEDDVL